MPDKTQSSKRILLVSTVPETLFFLSGNLIGALKKSGWDVHLASSASSSWVSSKQVQEKYGLQTHTISFTRTISVLKDIIAVWQIISLVRKIKPCVIHASTPKAGLLAGLAGWLCNVPLRIYTVRGLPYYGKTGPGYVLLSSMEKVACACYHRVFSVSKSNRDYIVGHGLCAAEKISIIHNGSSQGVDSSRFNPANVLEKDNIALQNNLTIAKNALVVGFVGRLVKDKGVEELLTAWDVVITKFPKSVLLIVGPDREPRDTISDAAYKKLKSSKSIILAGSTFDTLPYYAIMSLLVHPSHREGFPNVVLEASAMELPVVTTSAPGCIDSVKDGETGYIVPVNNPTELAEKIIALLNNPDLRTKMGKAAREWVVRDFNPQDICEEMMRKYEEGRI
jgi:glycosyltransferase involved in cell wall biosynthesis